MIFLRHPTPDIEPNICYGQSDMGIAEIAHSQIDSALRTTPKLTRLVSSPALRCQKLAESLATRHNLEIIFDVRLWEMHMGDWEGIPWASIDRKQSDQWLEDPINHPTPNGECFADLQNRVSQCVDAYLDHEALTTGFVCHAGPIRAVQMAWLSLSFDEVFAKSPGYAEPIRILHPDLKDSG